MDTKRRMTEIKVWEYPFFCEFTHSEKLFYWFVQCHADNVGVYTHSPKLVNFHCKQDDDNDSNKNVIDFETFIQKYNHEEERVLKISNNKIWIKSFIQETWGTISARNNLGLSCYKLLVKHGLLETFISLYPNSINIGSFREAIKNDKEKYGNLPLPQSNPKSATINNPISKNQDISYSINSLMSKLRRKIPKKNLSYPDHVLEADLSQLVERLAENGVNDVNTHLLSLASEIDWSKNDWDSFIKLC